MSYFILKLKGGFSMTKNAKTLCGIIVVLIVICILCGIHIANNSFPSYDDEFSPLNNSKIRTDEITVTPTQEVMASTYDYIMLEITNNSKYQLYLNNGTYNIYKKNGTEYILIDTDNDGFTYNEKNTLNAIEIQNTEQLYFYLGALIDNGTGYTRTGEYKIEIPLNENSVITAYFEITDETINPDTDISISCDEEYSINDERNFSYFIINNSEEDIEVTLSVGISQYKGGKWVRLPFSDKYYDIHYNAAIWSENLSAKSQRAQEFGLSLADMVDMELTPGKYRLEKQIGFSWYFAEFEVC